MHIRGCHHCPYVKREISLRKKSGFYYPNNTEILYCLKLDCEINEFGCCEEGDDSMGRNSYQNPRKLNRYERNKKYKNKLKRIAENGAHYPAGAYYETDKDISDWDPLSQNYHAWIRENAKYIKRYYRANHAPGYSGFLKKQASKKFRRYRGKLANGCAYKKTFDYWWELI